MKPSHRRTDVNLAIAYPSILPPPSLDGASHDKVTKSPPISVPFKLDGESVLAQNLQLHFRAIWPLDYVAFYGVGEVAWIMACLLVDPTAVEVEV